MATKAKIASNDRRKKLSLQHGEKRKALKEVIRKPASTPEERYEAQMKLQALPRNSAPTRVRNRCELTGRPRGYYRKFGLSRIALRELSLEGVIPGVTKSSW